MSKLQNAVMVHPAEVRVTTTAGDCIYFRPNVRTFVPAYSVAECLRHGARLVARVKGSDKPRISARQNAGVTSLATFPEVESYEVQEVDSLDDVLLAGNEDPVQMPRNTQPYTPVEEKLRRAIQKIITNADQADFTSDFLPTLAAIRAHVTDVRVTASGRDRVWAKMLKNGEITQSDIDSIFTRDEEVDEVDPDDEDEVLEYGDDADDSA